MPECRRPRSRRTDVSGRRAERGSRPTTYGADETDIIRGSFIVPRHRGRVQERGFLSQRSVPIAGADASFETPQRVVPRTILLDRVEGGLDDDREVLELGPADELSKPSSSHASFTPEGVAIDTRTQLRCRVVRVDRKQSVKTGTPGDAVEESGPRVCPSEVVSHGP